MKQTVRPLLLLAIVAGVGHAQGSTERLEVPTHAFAATYGETLARNVGYAALSFSPNGRLLALTISQIATGDPEQVWLFDTMSKRMRLATEVVDRSNVGLRILSVRWDSAGTALIECDRTDWKNQSNNRHQVVRATMDTSIVQVQPWPTRANAKMYASYPSPSRKYVVEVFTAPRRTQVRDVRANSVVLTALGAFWEEVTWSADDANFAFTATNIKYERRLYGGTMSRPANTFLIAKGSTELDGYAIAPSGPRIAYTIEQDIVFYDLRTRQLLPTRLFVGWHVENHMAWSSDNRIAYVAATCSAPAKPTDNGETRDERLRVCIAHVPG